MFKYYRLVSSIVCLLALALSGARVASASQQFSIPLGPGSVNWSVITYNGSCGGPGSGNDYTEWAFGGFTYVDAWGNNYPLVAEGAAEYISSPGPPYCPPNGPMASPLPLYMSGGTAVISFYMASGGAGSATAVNLPTPGYVNPKYVVIDLMYDPPGTSSNAMYAHDTVVGSTTSMSNSISAQSTLSSSSIFGFEGGTKYTSTYSTSYTQAVSSSSSIAINQTSSTTIGLYGCTVGLNHQCDMFGVWLNPLLIYGVAPNTSVADWFGYGINWADTGYYPDMEVPQVPMGMLDGDPNMPMSQGFASEFARAWAPNNVDGSGPGLTQTDFNNIVAGNPFSNPNYTLQFTPPSPTTNDGRFTAVSALNTSCGATTVPYGQNTYYQCALGYTTTATSSETATQTYLTGWALEEQYQNSAFGITFGSDVKSSTTLTETQVFSQSTNNSQGQTSSITVIGYPAGTNYSGPNSFTLWQDNIYGTFMLYP